MRCIAPGPVLVAVLAAVTGAAVAEQLPLTFFTTSQGLLHNRINDIYLCSRGYLWFSTPDGLSRFDGHTFLNYGWSEGLEPLEARELIQTARGDYWVATGGPELFYLDSAGTEPGQLFRKIPLQPGSSEARVETVMQDRAGRLWAGTSKGLFVSDRSDDQAAFRRVDLQMDGIDHSEHPVNARLSDFDAQSVQFAFELSQYNPQDPQTSALYCNPALLLNSSYYQGSSGAVDEARGWIQFAADSMTNGAPHAAALGSWLGWWRSGWAASDSSSPGTTPRSTTTPAARRSRTWLSC